MGVWRVTIVKGGSFQEPPGVEWSNVYTLKTPTGVELNAGNAIDSIVALEKSIHSSEVRFLRGTVYIKSLLGFTFEPYFGKDLIGVGALDAVATNPEIYRECAVLAQFELPRAGGLIGIGRSRRLSKWLHVYRLHQGDGAAVTGSGPLPPLCIERHREFYATPLMNLEHGGGLLTNEDGDRPVSADIQAHLNHHQYHRGT